MTDHLQAGRELDALVAEKVFGWTVEWLNAHRDYECGDWSVCQFCHPADGSAPEPCNMGDVRQPAYNPPDVPNEWYRDVVPEFSTEIAAAWLMVEHFNERGRDAFFELNYGPHMYGATFIQGLLPDVGETAPLAICRAALSVVAT